VTIQQDQVGKTLDSLQSLFTQQQLGQGQSGVVNSNPGSPVLDMTVAQAISTIQSQSGQGDQVSTFLSILDELPADQKTALLTALSTGNMQDPSMQPLYIALQTGAGIITTVQNFSDMQPTPENQSANATATQNVVNGTNMMVNMGLSMVSATETEVSNMTPAQLSAQGMTTQDQSTILDFLKAIGTALSAARQLLGQISTQDAKNQKEITDVEQAVNSEMEEYFAAALGGSSTVGDSSVHGSSTMTPLFSTILGFMAEASFFAANGIGPPNGFGPPLAYVGIAAASIALDQTKSPVSGIVSGSVSSMMSAMKSALPPSVAEFLAAAVIVAAVVALRSAPGEIALGNLGGNGAQGAVADGDEGLPNEESPNQIEGGSGQPVSSTAGSAAQTGLTVVSQGANVVMASNAISEGTQALIKAIKGSIDADDQMIAMLVQTIVILVAAMAALSGGGGSTGGAGANLGALKTAAQAFQGGEGLSQIASGLDQGVTASKQGKLEQQLAQLIAELTKQIENQNNSDQISASVQGNNDAGQTMSGLAPFFANISKDDSQTITPIGPGSS
jgi:hypothetical protein